MAVSLPGPVLAGNPYPRRPETGPGGGEGGAAGDASGYRYWLPAGPLPCCAAQHPPLTAGRQRVRALRVLSLLPGRKREHATLLKLRRRHCRKWQCERASAQQRVHAGRLLVQPSLAQYNAPFLQRRCGREVRDLLCRLFLTASRSSSTSGGRVCLCVSVCFLSSYSSHTFACPMKENSKETPRARANGC